MRKVLAFLLCLVGLLSFSSSFAKTPTNATRQVTANNQINNKDDFVLLYDKPDKGKVLTQLAPNLRLVPIIQKGNWVKVGDPRNGKVGWINLVQYEKARNSYYKPDIQTLFISLTSNNKNGKPTLNVVAYKNGKKISKKEANKIYSRLRKKQEEQFQKLQRFSLSMQNMMNQDFLNAERFFDSAWLAPTWMAPVILIQQPQNQNHPMTSPKRGSNKSDKTSV